MTAPAKVVLADDDAHIGCVVAMRLRSAGYEVSVAQDGEEALGLVHEVHPSLVITDLQMPHMSGLELALKLNEDPATRHIPVIVLTARGYLMDDAAIARTNIRHVLPKPFSAREVLRLASETLAQARDRGAEAA